MRASPLFGLSCAAALIAIAACGGRSPIGSIAWGEQASGGATTSTAGGGGQGGGGTTTTGSGGEAGHGATGSGGQGGFGPIDCMTCIGNECPEMLECLVDFACLQGLGCSALNCLGGGGEPDLECIGDCFGGDMGAAMQAMMGILCIMETCGAQCEGLLPTPPEPPDTPEPPDGAD